MRFQIWFLMVLTAAFPLGLSAQTYPAKSVRVIIAFPPGGSNDFVGRIVFQKMTESLGRSFVLDNRGGAAGTIASDLVAKSAPDGYTLMVQSSTHVANPHLYKALPYDSLKDFVGISTLARQVGVLVVHPSMPVRSVKEFIALAKARPGEILYGSGGSGASYHLQMVLLESMANLKLTHVPYKGGGPAWTALVSGEVQAVFATTSGVIPHYKAGRVRPLAVSSKERLKQFPEIPTIAETVPGYEFVAWVGCFAPAGTPPAVVNMLNLAIAKVLADPDVATKLSAQALDPIHMPPDLFAERIRSDYEKYGKLIKLIGAEVN